MDVKGRGCERHICEDMRPLDKGQFGGHGVANSTNDGRLGKVSISNTINMWY
jgi:hypothetical protein